MRIPFTNQLWLSASSKESPPSKNELIRELEEMSSVLDSCPSRTELYERVKRDLVGDKRADCGATGLSAEQALRAALVKEKLNLSYRRLEFHLVDSVSLRNFVRLEPGKRVSKSVLNRDIRLISEETWEFLNEILKRYALSNGIEDGSRVRSDTTATKTNIHYPTDSSLLCDCIRILTRQLDRADEWLEGLDIEYHDHNRRAKKRLFVINNSRKKPEKRRQEYRDLIQITEWTQSYAENAVEALNEYQPKSIMAGVLLDHLREEIPQYIELTKQVVAQSIRRVLNGEKVPVEEKIVSIFEPHTDIIEKGGRETVFGHKVCLSSGQSGLILDCQILEGNPADTSLVDDIITRHKGSYGSAPKQIAFDGGFASAENAHRARQHGVVDVAFSKTKKADILTLVSSKALFNELTNFRAGIEAGISALKRSYGFTRVLQKGWDAFKTSLLNGVAAFNLTLIARHQLKQT